MRQIYCNNNFKANMMFFLYNDDVEVLDQWLCLLVKNHFWHLQLM